MKLIWPGNHRKTGKMQAGSGGIAGFRFLTKKSSPGLLFKTYSGLFPELPGFLEIPYQCIYQQKGSEHNAQPQVAAGFAMARKFGVIE